MGQILASLGTIVGPILAFFGGLNFDAFFVDFGVGVGGRGGAWSMNILQKSGKNLITRLPPCGGAANLKGCAHCRRPSNQVGLPRRFAMPVVAMVGYLPLLLLIVLLRLLLQQLLLLLLLLLRSWTTD